MRNLNKFKNEISKISLEIEYKLLKEFNDIKDYYSSEKSKKECNNKVKNMYISFGVFYDLCVNSSNVLNKNTKLLEEIDMLNHKISTQLRAPGNCFMNWVEKIRQDYFKKRSERKSLLSEENINIQIRFKNKKLYNYDHLFVRTPISDVDYELGKKFILKNEDFVLLYNASCSKEDFFIKASRYYIARELTVTNAINNSKSFINDKEFKQSYVSNFYSLKECKKNESYKKILEGLGVVNDRTVKFVKEYLILIFSFCEKIYNKTKKDILLKSNIKNLVISDLESLFILMNPLDTFKNITGECNPYFKDNLHLFVKALKQRYGELDLIKECSIYFV